MSRPTPSRTAVACGTAVLASTLTLGGQALASHGADHAGTTAGQVEPPENPTRAQQIQNIDQVRTAIKAYYGDTETSTPDPVDGTKTLHTYAADGNYAEQMYGLTKHIRAYVRKAATLPMPSGISPAIVLDVDDTSLNTFNYEVYSNFAYNPSQNAAFVNSASFPAVPGMKSVAGIAAAKGVSVFFLTGRPESQRAGTVDNLTKVGYATPDADHLYLKDQTNQPWLSSCSPACTTVQYKSLTRAHIESLGYRIVANVGDQFSDLKGGHASETYKVPNPMYYLP